jgi:hypothetical protein
MEKPQPEKSDSGGAEITTAMDSNRNPVDRFKSFARRIVRVPLDDLKEQERQYEERKRQNR